jgi:hypothetical protein
MSSSRHRIKPKIIHLAFVPSKHASFKEKRKEWLARNQNNICEWGDMFTRGLLLR